MASKITNENNVENMKVLREPEPNDDRLYFSKYTRIFDRENYAFWGDCNIYAWLFLRRQEDYANLLLMSRGHLLLNDVYKMLNMSPIDDYEGVGWIYDEENPIGDNYVDFGIYNSYNRDFVIGYEKRAIIDPNVDGYIADKIPKNDETL